MSNQAEGLPGQGIHENHSAVKLQKGCSLVWFGPLRLQLDVGLIRSPPSSRQKLVHVETPFSRHQKIGCPSQLVGENA